MAATHVKAKFFFFFFLCVCVCVYILLKENSCVGDVALSAAFLPVALIYIYIYKEKKKKKACAHLGHNNKK